MNIKITHWIMAGCLAFMATGCGPQPKPEELLQLEELRASEESAQINQIAPEAYRKCTDLTDKAISAWQDDELSTAKTYASLGQRQYATAKAESQRREALARRDAAKAEHEKLTLQMETLRVKQAGLETNIAQMKTNIALADNANAEHRIQVAKTEAEKARAVEADISDASKAIFAEANTKLNAAGNANAYGKREEASALADEATALFTKAYTIAKPDFDKKQATVLLDQTRKSIYEEAKTILGPSYVISTDMKATIMVFAEAFAKDKYEIASDKQPALDRLAALLAKYPTAQITIEGYVQKSTKQYFEVSTRRAEAVRDYLIARGVDYKRIIASGKGKDMLRYDEKVKANRPLNDRVEIIITLNNL